MIVFHVTSFKKLKKYQEIGFIKSPVRAWTNINDAIRFSIQTGRAIILRLNFPDNTKKVQTLEGHKGMAVIYNDNFDVGKILGYNR